MFYTLPVFSIAASLNGLLTIERNGDVVETIYITIIGVEREYHGTTVTICYNLTGTALRDDATTSKLRRSLNHTALGQTGVISFEVIIAAVILDSLSYKLTRLHTINRATRSSTAINVSLNQSIRHSLANLVAETREVVVSSEARIVATVTVLIIEENTIEFISLEFSLQLTGKLAGGLVTKVCTASTVVVTQDTQDNLYTLLLQRYEILLTVVEQMLHVLVVVVVHLTGLSVVVDVTREEDNLVDNQLTSSFRV